MAQQELNRTLQISRAMLGLYREPKAPVAVDLRELLESVLLLLDRQLKDQSVAVQRKLQEGTSIQGFPGELRQVFTNLITNAAEAAGPGGRVQVLLEASLPADNRAGGNGGTITDSGPGVPESHQAKLFKPFFFHQGGVGNRPWAVGQPGHRREARGQSRAHQQHRFRVSRGGRAGLSSRTRAGLGDDQARRARKRSRT